MSHPLSGIIPLDGKQAFCYANVTHFQLRAPGHIRVWDEAHRGWRTCQKCETKLEQVMESGIEVLDLFQCTSKRGDRDLQLGRKGVLHYGAKLR